MIEFEPARSDHKPNLASLLGLTSAERTVVLAAGALKSNGEIAAEIGRSLGTVKSELHSAYKKLGVRTRSELVSLLRAEARAWAWKTASTNLSAWSGQTASRLVACLDRRVTL